MAESIRPELSPQDRPQDQLQLQLKALADLFAEKLPGKLFELEQCMHACQQATDAAIALDHLAVLHRLLHSMAGSAGMFGFDEIGRRARALELQAGSLSNAAPLEPLADNLRNFLGWAARHVKGEAEPDEEESSLLPSTQGMVFVLAADNDATGVLMTQLEHGGVELWHLLDPEQLETALMSQVPVLVVADLASLPGISESEVATMVAAAGSDIALIFVAGAGQKMAQLPTGINHYYWIDLPAGVDPGEARKQVLPAILATTRLHMKHAGNTSSP